jgi:hypothetical protein
LEELVIQLKIYDSHTSCQQFHDVFDLQEVRCTNASSLWNLLLVTCRASQTGTFANRLTSKLMRVSEDWRFTDFNNCTKWTQILNEGFRFSAKSTQYLMKITAQGTSRGANRTHCRPQRNVRFVNLGKTI